MNIKETIAAIRALRSYSFRPAGLSHEDLLALVDRLERIETAAEDAIEESEPWCRPKDKEQEKAMMPFIVAIRRLRDALKEDDGKAIDTN